MQRGSPCAANGSGGARAHQGGILGRGGKGKCILSLLERIFVRTQVWTCFFCSVLKPVAVIREFALQLVVLGTVGRFFPSFGPRKADPFDRSKADAGTRTQLG